jgi:hypothetical protein
MAHRVVSLRCAAELRRFRSRTDIEQARAALIKLDF